MICGKQWRLTVSLIKTKSNEEVWGTVKRFRGNVETARFRTRVGHIINKRIDDFYVLTIAPKICDILRFPSRDFLNERDYRAEKFNAYKLLHNYGRFPAKNFIMERCIVFEGGISRIPREHRQYRICDKPIGK